MKLSIVIPVYNGAEFIKKSYNSVVRQQLKDYELVYIDNNSTDNSASIIKGLMEKDQHIKLYSQPIQGEAPARNKGIEVAQGEYFYQLDVDDEVMPGALKKMMSVLDTYESVEAVFGKMYTSDKTLDTLELPLNETNEVSFKEKPYWGLRWFSSLKHVVGPPAFMFRKEVFNKIGNYNEELKTIGCDTAMDINLGMTCNVAFIDTYIYLYFRHEASLVENVKRKLPRAFMVWPRLVKIHLPFYLANKVPLRFKQLLFGQLFQSMGRQIYFTKGFSNRKKLKRELAETIKPIEVPFSINLFLSILVLFPMSILLKYYKYKLVPNYVKTLTL